MIAPSPFEAVREMEFMDTVSKALHDLSVDEQRVLRLRFVEDLTHPEIAGRIGMSRAMVRNREFSALRKMRHPGRIKQLEEWMEWCKERDMNSPHEL